MLRAFPACTRSYIAHAVFDRLQLGAEKLQYICCSRFTTTWVGYCCQSAWSVDPHMQLTMSVSNCHDKTSCGMSSSQACVHSTTRSMAAPCNVSADQHRVRPWCKRCRITSCAALSPLSVSALCKAVSLAYSAPCSAMFCLLPASSVAACVVQRRSSKAVAGHKITYRLLFRLVYAWQAEDLQVSQSDLYMLCVCAGNMCQHQRLLKHQREDTLACAACTRGWT